MKKRILIIGVLLISILSHSANFIHGTVNMNVHIKQDKDQKTKYEERKKWIKERKSELLTLCNELINLYDFPKANIEAERDKLKLRLWTYERDIKSVDYADDKKFEAIQKKFDNLESYFKTYAENLRERQNLRR